MYKWIEKTANPLAGECLHNCKYCYVSAMKKRNLDAINKKYSGIPKVSENGIKQLKGKDKLIFISSMNDMFAKNVRIEDIIYILNELSYKNRYLFQTKNPARLIDDFWQLRNGDFIPIIDFIHEKSIITTTVESNVRYKEMGHTPELIDRIKAIKEISAMKRFETQITIEPIMNFNLDFFVSMLKDADVNQINIGADSGYNNLHEPTKEKVLQLISELEKFTVVKQKSNLKRLLV